jgi:hypothetical protein
LKIDFQGRNIMKNYCLIISCSKKKNRMPKKCRAIDIYTGINYKTIKKLKRENKLLKNIDILIISAKYGLIHPDSLINTYEMKMTKKRALELNPVICKKLEGGFDKKKFSEIFINLGKEYMMAINGFEELLPNNTKIVYAHGGIGQRLSQMKKWIIDKNSILR